MIFCQIIQCTLSRYFGSDSCINLELFLSLWWIIYIVWDQKYPNWSLVSHLLFSMCQYYDLIYPYLSHCNIVWASTIHLILASHTNCIIHHLPLDPSTKLSFIENHWGNNLFKIGIFRYKCNNHLLPMSFDTFFVRSSDVHSHDTSVLILAPL